MKLEAIMINRDLGLGIFRERWKNFLRTAQGGVGYRKLSQQQPQYYF